MCMKDIYASVAAATVSFQDALFLKDSIEEGGQGVLVNDSDGGMLIVTAAHCVVFGKSEFSRQLNVELELNRQLNVEEVIQGDLFRQTVKINDREFTVRPLAVEPYADIAVLGALDDQEFPDEADAFLTFCADIEPVPLCQKDLEFGDEFPVHVYTHKGQWVTGNAIYNGGPMLFIEFNEQIEGGTSGGPIINDSGELVGVASSATNIETSILGKCVGTQPYLALALPVWVSRRYHPWARDFRG
jgi:hypothetical protein